MNWSDLSRMSPRWIAHRVELEILTTSLEVFRGPRITTMGRDENEFLWYTCDDWYFPTSATAYHVHWRDRVTGEVFHRMRIDPPVKGEEGEKLVLSGKLRGNRFSDRIENE